MKCEYELYMDYIKADQLPFDPRPQLSRIFVEGFYPWIKHFSRDKEQLIAAFSHTFDLRCFYIAMENDEIAAMAACTDGNAPVFLDRKIFIQTMGVLRGCYTYYVLGRYIRNSGYPFKLSRTTGSIEYVATAEAYQGRGIAQGLLTHIINTEVYTAYVLEFADTNTTAFRLYERLGFKEIDRKKAPRRRNGGVNYFIYMRRG